MSLQDPDDITDAPLAHDAEDMPENPGESEIEDIRWCLGYLGFEADVRDNLANLLFSSWRGVTEISFDTLKEKIRSLERLPPDNPRSTFVPGYLQDKLYHFIYWARDQKLLGIEPPDIRITELTHARVRYAAERRDILKQYKEGIADSAQKEMKPGMFEDTPKGYVWLYEKLPAYLATFYGSMTLPLDYVIRKQTEPEIFDSAQASYDTFEAMAKHTVRLRGPAYRSDNNAVYSLITGLLPDHIVETLMPRNHRHTQDGRAVFMALSENFVQHHGEQAMQQAGEQILATLKYVDERQYSFSRFRERLLQAFTYLDWGNRKKSEQEKMDILLNKTEDAAALKYTHELVRTRRLQEPNFPFRTALYWFDSKITPFKTTKSNKNNRFKASETKSKNKKGGGKGKDPKFSKGKKGNHRKQPRIKWDDYVSQEEYDRMTNDQKLQLREKRQQRLARQQRLSSVTTDDQTVGSDVTTQLQSVVSQQRELTDVMTRALQQATASNQQPQATTNMGGRSAAAVAADERRDRQNCALTVSERRTVSLTRASPMEQRSYLPHKWGRIELDTHADTFCAGANFVPLHFTQQVVDVSPYSEDYSPMKDVPIATVATLWTHPDTSEQFVLVVNEAIYFGDRLDHSLANPNQMRHFGVQVQDNPYSRDRLAITQDEHHIPLSIEGVTIYLDTCTPSQEELDTLTHITLTSDSQWDPHHVTLGAVHSAVEEEMKQE
jgi:hypothetical protein